MTGSAHSRSGGNSYLSTHPVTNKTIPRYNKLIKKPLLRDDWMKAMSVKLSQLSQGHNGINDINGTGIIKFIAVDGIPNIPQDCTVTYGRIVVNYHLQKKAPNRARIIVGDNLIYYRYKLTT